MRLSIAATVACLSIVGLSAADEVKAAIRKDTNISAQGLGPALQLLAKERGFQIVYVSDEVNSLRTQGASGELTREEALAKLLSGTGMTYAVFGENSFSIVSVAAASAPSARPSSSSSGIEPSSATVEDERGGGQKSFWDRFRLAQADRGQVSDGRSLAEQKNVEQRSSMETASDLEEIIVTAQKREERLQDVPISISVLSGAGLDRSTVEGITEALSRVPGTAVNVTYQGGGTQVVMRGVTAGGALFAGSSPVSYYLDSIPFGFVKSAISPDASAYDLDRVEVLRGPQGTLYGASAQNGVVRVLTKNANPDKFEFKARTLASGTEGGGENYRGDVAINVPIVEGKLAARAVVGYQDLSGWIDRPNQKNVNDGQIRNMRLKINAEPIDDLSVGLTAWRSRADYGGPSTSDDNGRQVALHDEPTSTEFDTYGLKIDYSFPAFSVSSMTSYLDYVNDSYRDLLYFFDDTLSQSHFESKVFAQEVILNSTHEGSWRWSLGGIYRDAEDLLLSRTHLLQAPPPITGTDHGDVSRSFALFGDLTRLLLDGQLELTAGLRYFEDEVRGRENSNGAGLPLIRTSSKFDATSPRLVLTWHPSDQVTAYVSYAEGFRSGFDQYPVVIRLEPDFPPLKADTLHNYEVGAKGSLFDGRVSFDTAVYYMDWQDVQQALTVTVDGLPFTANVNGDSASGIGFDLGVTTEPVDGLELGVNFSWNYLSMDSDVFSEGALLFSKAERLNLSPEYTASAWADYVFPLGRNGFKGRFSASANYISEMDFRTIVAGDQSIAAGDPMLIARTSFSIDAPNNWVATVLIDNINNEQGSPVGFPFVPGVITDWDARVRPRTIGVQLEYHY